MSECVCVCVCAHHPCLALTDSNHNWAERTSERERDGGVVCVHVVTFLLNFHPYFSLSFLPHFMGHFVIKNMNNHFTLYVILSVPSSSSNCTNTHTHQSPSASPVPEADANQHSILIFKHVLFHCCLVLSSLYTLSLSLHPSIHPEWGLGEETGVCD